MGIRTNDELGGIIGGDTTGTNELQEDGTIKRGMDINMLNDMVKIAPDTRAQTELIAALSLTNEMLVKIELHLQQITNFTRMN